MRLIDADALVERIVKLTCVPCREKGNDYKGVRCRACQYGDEIDDIVSAPTIEPQRQSGRKVYQAGYKDGYEAARKVKEMGTCTGCVYEDYIEEPYPCTRCIRSADGDRYEEKEGEDDG